MKTLIITIISIVILGACEALAWDGEHKGFVLGGGVGLTKATLLIRQADYKYCFQTNLKIGYAINNHWQIHYSGISVWKMHDLLNHLTIGTTYYIRPQAPTFFASGGLGLSSDIWDLSDGGSYIGYPTIVAGLGYEIFRHIGLEATALTTKPKYNNELRWSFHLGINILAY